MWNNGNAIFKIIKEVTKEYKYTIYQYITFIFVD